MKKLHEKGNRQRLGRYAAVCAACIMFWATGINGWAARTGNIRIDNVNIRSEASTESSRVCKLPINTTVNVVEEATGSDGNVWYSITFTLEGAEKAGWIRSDMLTVSETEEPEGTGEEGEGNSAAESAAYTIQEPIESYDVSDVLIQTAISVEGQSYTAWQVDPSLTGDQELYLVSAARADGSIGWFYYDPTEETFQRDLGQFSHSQNAEPEGLIAALQEELTKQQELSEEQLGMRLYIIIGLAVLCVIFLTLAIVFGLKYRNAAYEYYEEDDDEDDDDDDDFFTAVKKKQAESKAEEIAEEELPAIDMSAVLEVEEEVRKEKEDKEPEDFDIEILDWEDLGL